MNIEKWAEHIATRNLNLNGNCKLVVAVDASRNRSGGAIAHLLGIIGGADPREHGIEYVHVWSYKKLLKALPDKPWLVKHNPNELEQSILSQIWWQRFKLNKEVKRAGCSILLNTDAGTVSRYRPCVTMSRDMLSYEPGEIERFGISKAWLRLLLLRYMQNRSLRNSDGTIFLTQYAANIIQQSCGQLSRIAFIPHGVGSNFKLSMNTHPWPENNERPIRCLYISNAALYKHQWVVVKAIADLRGRGYNLNLELVGGGTGNAQRLLDAEIARTDPKNTFVTQTGFVAQSELPKYLSGANLFIFASSCENMPNTLIEAMASGLPIACSSRGPMPEILQDAGAYFDPEDPKSIAVAVEKLLTDSVFRSNVAKKASELANQYSWARCAKETWSFLADIADEHKNSISKRI